MIEESRYYRQVREFAVKVKPWQLAIRYSTMPDEQNDPTLISRRVYGTPDEVSTVMAAAGMDRVNAPIPAGTELILPTPEQITILKAQAGYPTPPVKSIR